MHGSAVSGVQFYNTHIRANHPNGHILARIFGGQLTGSSLCGSIKNPEVLHDESPVLSRYVVVCQKPNEAFGWWKDVIDPKTKMRFSTQYVPPDIFNVPNCALCLVPQISGMERHGLIIPNPEAKVKVIKNFPKEERTRIANSDYIFERPLAEGIFALVYDWRTNTISLRSLKEEFWIILEIPIVGSSEKQPDAKCADTTPSVLTSEESPSPPRGDGNVAVWMKSLKDLVHE
ncbi:MAG: hypothetical protein PHS02_02995 [Candidatus ainarchaeum sp.]|nr:hypothetical protein [Candidatus ainarchaeum sp.]